MNQRALIKFFFSVRAVFRVTISRILNNTVAYGVRSFWYVDLFAALKVNALFIAGEKVLTKITRGIVCIFATLYFKI